MKNNEGSYHREKFMQEIINLVSIDLISDSYKN